MSESLPLVAQKGSYKMEVELGKAYWWCACGKSGKQPFCDGSHKGTGFSPVKFDATETGIVSATYGPVRLPAQIASPGSTSTG